MQSLPDPLHIHWQGTQWGTNDLCKMDMNNRLVAFLVMDEQFFDNTDLCYYSADMYSIFLFFSYIFLLWIQCHNPSLALWKIIMKNFRHIFHRLFLYYLIIPLSWLKVYTEEMLFLPWYNGLCNHSFLVHVLKAWRVITYI